MRLFLACMFIAFGWIQNASADIIFTLVQDTPGLINPGDDAVFNVFIRTDGGQIVDNVGGIDFWISANDPAQTGNETSGGQFVSGTDPYFLTPAGNPSPYQFFFPTSLQVFSGSADPGLDLGPTNTLLAQITLSTVGAIPGGTYEMSLTNLVAVDPNSFDLGVVNQPTTTISYAIAVPEPASFGLVGLALAGAVLRRRAKQRASK